ncbi:B12-binding domain-containing radical SAM protein [Frankia sp. Cj5]|uniref:B12-binding domain-containing radical SAM protein n=1 Tax=Frankia sp. Cj5 TaxID=2880978 RepID=UPI001EF70AEE|nr:radical SAM protein [Frankia sp. Cj5]
MLARLLRTHTMEIIFALGDRDAPTRYRTLTTPLLPRCAAASPSGRQALLTLPSAQSASGTRNAPGGLGEPSGRRYDHLTPPRFNQIRHARHGDLADDTLDRRLAELAADRPGIVFDTWALAWLAPGPMMRVWIESDLESRARTCHVSQTHTALSLPECRDLARDKDEDTRANFLRRHGSDLFTDRHRYDLVLCNSHLIPVADRSCADNGIAVFAPVVGEAVSALLAQRPIHDLAALAYRRPAEILRIGAVQPDELGLDLTGYDVVGFSLASSATYGFMRELREHSQIDPGALVMVGGVHANFYPKESLADFRADVLCEGESEEAIVEVLDRAGAGRSFAGVGGARWVENGQVRVEPQRRLMKDIDRLPLPARHLLPDEDVVMADRLAGRDIRMAHVMFSRGCPFPCSFCAAGQTRIQYRSGASARTELTHLVDRYGVRGFAIVDDNFIVNKRKVSDICDAIVDLDLSWSALSRVDTVDAALLKTMAAAGCIEIRYGVESGSEALLRAMRKNTTREQIKAAFAATTDAGIGGKAFIIHGFSGESAETTAETMSLLTELVVAAGSCSGVPDDRRMHREAEKVQVAVFYLGRRQRSEAPSGAGRPWTNFRRRPLGSSLSRVSLFRFVPLPGTQVYADPGRYGLRGVHTQPGWDGDWSKFHIHHNDLHWWGSAEQWQETEDSYRRLRDFVEDHWNTQG